MSKTCCNCSYLQKCHDSNRERYYCNDHDCYVEDIYSTDNPCNDPD